MKVVLAGGTGQLEPRLLESGFDFVHPTSPEAARDLVRRRRAGSASSMPVAHT